MAPGPSQSDNEVHCIRVNYAKRATYVPMSYPYSTGGLKVAKSPPEMLVYVLYFIFKWVLSQYHVHIGPLQ